jgi:hypothetical protein
MTVDSKKMIGTALILFFSVAIAADYAFFNGARFVDIAPHPFWIIVLLLSVQYGTVAGLLAAATSTVVLLAGNLPPQLFSQDVYEYVFALSQRPLLWFAAAAVLGELRMGQIRERDTSRLKEGKTQRKLKVITKAYSSLKSTKNSLESRVAGQVRTKHSLCEAAMGITDAIARIDEPGVLDGVRAVTREVINPEQFSLFVAKPDGLLAVLTDGWDDETSLPRLIDADSALYRAVIQQQRLLCASRPEDQDALNGQGMLAGPLIDQDSGVPFGMLKIERLAFLELGSGAVENFRLVCDWLGMALTDVRRRAHAQIHPEAGVHPESAIRANGDTNALFEREAHKLHDLSKHFGFEVLMLSVRIKSSPGSGIGERQGFCAAVSDALRSASHSDDQVALYDDAESRCVVLLPGVGKDEGRHIVRGLEQMVRERLPISLEKADLTVVSSRFSVPVTAARVPSWG